MIIIIVCSPSPITIMYLLLAKVSLFGSWSNTRGRPTRAHSWSPVCTFTHDHFACVAGGIRARELRPDGQTLESKLRLPRL